MLVKALSKLSEKFLISNLSFPSLRDSIVTIIRPC